MKGALIPPKGWHETAKQSDYHLMLAQITDPEYRRMYANMDTDDYIILDNGAAEGNKVSTEELLKVAAIIGVDEIVVPDVMADAYATYEAAQDFFARKDLPDSTKYMLVVHGDTLHQCTHMIDLYKQRWPGATLALPRHLLRIRSGARLLLADYIIGEYGECPVHMLGSSSIWPAEVRHLGLNYPWVRGIDSSMPYNYAIADRRLNVIGPGVDRSEGYFSAKRELNEQLLQANIKTFLGWASGTEGAWS